MFTRLDGLEGFTPAVEALGPPEADPEALSDLTAAFCRMLLADPLSLPQGAVHMVTPAAAVRTLLPHLPGVTVQAVYAPLARRRRHRVRLPGADDHGRILTRRRVTHRRRAARPAASPRRDGRESSRAR
jgi:hypothetical protein